MNKLNDELRRDDFFDVVMQSLPASYTESEKIIRTIQIINSVNSDLEAK